MPWIVFEQQNDCHRKQTFALQDLFFNVCWPRLLKCGGEKWTTTVDFIEHIVMESGSSLLNAPILSHI